MELLSAKEAAKELNISQGTLHRFCRERKIRYTSLNGRDRKFKLEWLEEFVDTQIVAPFQPMQSARPSSLAPTQSSVPKDSYPPEDWGSLRLEAGKRVKNQTISDKS
jgi:excisionase family DNA binding protein